MTIAPLPPREVPWRSGDAPDCKSVYPGSIPGGTSIFYTQHTETKLAEPTTQGILPGRQIFFFKACTWREQMSDC